jgi:hypothetical protein
LRDSTLTGRSTAPSISRPARTAGSWPSVCSRTARSLSEAPLRCAECQHGKTT